MKTLASSFVLNRRNLLWAGAACAVSAPDLVGAQGARKITISYPTRSGASWPLWLASKAGIYQKHGLDVTLEFGVHPAGIATLVSGQSQMSNYGIEQILAASVREPSMVIMGSSLNKGNFSMVAHPSIKKFEQLKGKRIGIGRLGDPLYFFCLDLFEKYGLGPKDVQWVPTGTDATSRAKMLQAGQIDAALMVAPSYFPMEAQGFTVLDSLANHADIFVSTGYLFKKTWVKENPEIPAKLIMANAEAIKLFYEDKAAAVAAYRAFDPVSEDTAAGLYDLYKSRNVLDRIPLLQKPAVQSAVQRMVDNIPALKTFDAGQIVDMGPVRKLIASGYFRKLFGEQVAQEENAKLKTAY